MKTGYAIGLSILIGFLVWVYMEFWYMPSQTVTIKPRKDHNLVLLRLPTSHSPSIFGAPFWEARHTLAELTPCPACRVEAISHEKFFHDFVNKKREVALKYPDNFNEWVKKVCEIKNIKKGNKA